MKSMLDNNRSTKHEIGGDEYLWNSLSVFGGGYMVWQYLSQDGWAGHALAWVRLAGVIGLLAFGLLNWFGWQWPRYLGLVSLVTVSVITLIQSMAGGVTLCEVAQTIVIVWSIRSFWKELIAKVDNESDDADKPSSMVSLVLLLKETQFLEAPMLAKLASRAWGVTVTAQGRGDDGSDSSDGTSDEGEPPTVGSDANVDADDESFIVGESPLFMAKYRGAMFIINNFDRPYWEDHQGLAQATKELRMQRAIEEHRAWLSIDFLNGWPELSADERLNKAYRAIGRLLAELTDNNTLAVVVPSVSQLFPWNAETELLLKSESPRDALEGAAEPPVILVEKDDSRMQAATDEARSRWGEFVSAFEQRGENEEGFTVKAKFENDEHAEFMWVIVTGIENEVIYGRLGNEPANLPDLNQGMNVKVRVAELCDWLYVREGQAFGGFTIKLLGDQLNS